MNLRVMSFSLAALCAIAVAVVAPSLAAAAGETASTCVEGGAEFGNAHCTSTSGSTKGWKEVAIKAGEETQLTLAATGEQVLSTKIGEVATTVKATGVECVECMAKNQEVEGVADFTSSGGHLRFTGATINVASCKVVGGEFVTEPVKFTSSMLTYMKVSPVSGTTLAVIHLEKSGAEACALGSSITVTGEANVTASGATLTLAGALTVGGQAAVLSGGATMSAGLTGGEHHPISLSVSKATGETLSTCVEAAGGAGEFGDAHCTATAAGGGWKEVGAKAGEETQLTLAATSEFQEVSLRIGLAKVVIKATGVECVECMGKNQEVEGSAGSMDFTSGGHIRFTGATINLSSCKVSEWKSEAIKFTSTMPDDVLLQPVSGTTLSVVHLENNGTKVCALGSEITITGHTNLPATGSTLKIETGVEELKIGEEEALLKGEWTMSAGLTGGEHHPVVLTQA